MEKLETLDELVEKFANWDSEIKRLTKDADAYKEQIKKMMLERHCDSYTAGGYVVSCIVSERTSLNQEKMLDILKKDWASRSNGFPCPYVKTVEVLDMDALEAALYSQDIPKSVVKELDSCREVKKVTTLKCSREKEKKDE